MAPNKLALRLQTKDVILMEMRKAHELLVKDATGLSLGELKKLRANVSCHWSTYQATHAEIIANCDKIERVTELIGNLQEAASLTEDTRELIDSSIKNLQPTTAPVFSEIKIEKFDGTQSEWPAWRSVFEDKVLNTSLRPSQKIDLLLGALEGSARRVAGRAEKRDVDELNRIWGKLVINFENQYQQVCAHIHEIIYWPKIQSPCAIKYREMINNVEEHLRLLERYDVGAKHWGAILCVILTDTLDDETRYLWSTHSDKPALPNADDLFKFLYVRCRALDDGAKSKQSTASKISNDTNALGVRKSSSVPYTQKIKKNSESTSQTKPYSRSSDAYKFDCKSCDSTAHPIFRCPTFTEMTVQTRIDMVKNNGLCQKCLGTNHRSADCKRIMKCFKCQSDSHNTLLCYNKTDAHVETTRSAY